MNVVCFPGMAMSFRPTASFPPQQRVRIYEVSPICEWGTPTRLLIEGLDLHVSSISAVRLWAYLS